MEGLGEGMGKKSSHNAEGKRRISLLLVGIVLYITE